MRVPWTLALAAGAALALATSPARAATLCVGPGSGCFAAIQPAVNAAHDGDTITIAPGTYAGGITMNVSVSIVGAGARTTVIRGGSPVVLVGAPFPWSSKRPTVSIRGVTITGGVNSSFPDPPVVQGGGVVITPSANPEPDQPGLTGATVTIADSVIAGNRVFATDQIPPGFCGPRACAFADGGGIDNSGTLTLTNTQVTDNEAVSPPGVATSVSGGAIFNHPQGTLVVRRSSITGNHVRAAGPNGREASAGGINSAGPLTIEDSVVSGNTAELAGPSEGIDNAHAGGIVVADAAATITNTIVSDNRVVATNVGGDLGAFGGGIVSFGPLTLRGGSVVHNQLTVTSSGGGAFADGGGLEVDGPTTISDTVIGFNSVTTSGPGHLAVSQGGGLANAGQTTVRRTLVVGNTISATGADGIAQGGGIWNGTFGGGPDPTLTVLDSSIVGNSARGSAGIAVAGGGVYTDFPVTIQRTLIAGNTPDQCSGC
jgi:hypothetical protein